MITTTGTGSFSSKSFPKVTSGDVWGGLAASAVVLPQAMAFGVALLSPNGFNASQGAIAGLLGAAILCIVSGLFGGTRGLISAPTGPTLVLLAGAMASITQTGVTGSNLLLNLSLVIMVTGLFLVVIGVTGGGKLIKYIPYPVISGFLTGSAILMIMSQVSPLSGKGVSADWQSWHWLPLITAIVTLASTHFAPKYLKAIPGTIAGLLVGMIFFHIVASFNSAELPQQWLIGELPKLESVDFTFSKDLLQIIQWQIVIPSALALAILISLDTLLTAVIADVTTGLRHNANREMIGQGVGQLVVSLFGGMAAAGTTGATVVAVKSGGRRWAGVFAGITFFILILVGRDAGRILPISVLAGIIIAVSLHMLDFDIFVWLKKSMRRNDAIIAILVTAVTVTYDLMIAVGLGVVIAIILFIKTQIKAPVVHRKSTGKQIHSFRLRNVEERELLDKHGECIVLYELRGNLFFATADALLDDLAADLDEPKFIILHMRRVLQVDLTAIKFLQQIASRLQKNGGTLIFCNIHREIGIGKKMQKAFKKAGVSADKTRALTFNGKDEALEYAENALLEELDRIPTKFSDSVELKSNDLCRELTDDELENFSTVLEKRLLKENDKLFCKGDTEDGLYMLISGEIEIRLPTTKHHYKRLATCTPGSFFGELALLNPGPRVADAIVTHDSEVYYLNNKGLQKLREFSPDTAITILMTLARIQVEYLRWSTNELQRLSEW